jgi:hypothetical protein
MSQDVKISNVWQKDINGEHVQVYAGVLAKNPTQGIIIIRRISNDLKYKNIERILAP